MSTRRNPSMSDRRLRALLKQLRETPAAPQDFRARVLHRLADDGMLRGQAASKPSLRARLSVWLRPATLGLAACGALALAVVLRPVPPPQAFPAASRPQVPQAKPSLAARPLAHRRPAAAAAPLQPAPVPAQDVAVSQPPLQAQAPEAVGAAAPPKAEEALVRVAQVTATMGPEPRGGTKPFPTEGSEVRNNVVRVSLGQPSDVHFSFVTNGHVRVDILDRLGRVVSVLYDGTLSAGEYDGNGAALACPWCLWNDMTDQGAAAASGIYLVRIQTPDYVHIHKLMLIK
jgi:hypothetical protein